MPTHRPYEFVPVDVPITWRRRLFRGSPLKWLVSLLVWGLIITSVFFPWFWAVVAFAIVCAWIGSATRRN